MIRLVYARAISSQRSVLLHITYTLQALWIRGILREVAANHHMEIVPQTLSFITPLENFLLRAGAVFSGAPYSRHNAPASRVRKIPRNEICFTNISSEIQVWV